MVQHDNDGPEEGQPLITSSGSFRAPPDRRYTVFLIFGFLGLASLLPWNFFITAKKYFDYKFRNTTLPSDVPFDGPGYNTDMQVKFESYLSIVSNGTNLVFMFLTLLLVRHITVKTRIAVSTFLMIGIFVVTTALVKVDTDSWQEQFFILTLGLATCMSAFMSVLQGSVLGLSAVFPPIYSQSAMIGQAAGGTFSSVVSIITLASGGSAINSALIYFSTATVVTVLALVAFLSLYAIKFSRYYILDSSGASKALNEDLTTKPPIHGKQYFSAIFKKTWMYCLSVTLVFMVTLAIFPSVCSLIKTTSKEVNEWTGTYFTPVVCFLLFNVGDFVGRLSTFVLTFPGPNRPKTMLFLCILRIGFVPLLMLCNAQPRSLPVVFDSDVYPIVFISLMGLSNGYLGTLCMSFGPIGIGEGMAEGAGMTLALAMVFGLAGGSGLSLAMVHFL